MTPSPAIRFAFAFMVDFPEPAQSRSRAALERLLHAGEALLAENRYEETSVADLASKARSSVGTFYRLLGDKETLSLLLLQRFFIEVAQRVETLTALERWSQRPVTEFTRALVELFVQVYEGRRGVLRAMITRASVDARFRDRVHQLNQFVGQRCMAVLATKIDAIQHPNPLQAMMAVVPMVLGVLNHHTLTGSLAFLSSDALADELDRLFCCYLGITV